MSRGGGTELAQIGQNLPLGPRHAVGGLVAGLKAFRCGFSGLIEQVWQEMFQIEIGSVVTAQGVAFVEWVS